MKNNNFKRIFPLVRVLGFLFLLHLSASFSFAEKGPGQTDSLPGSERSEGAYLRSSPRIMNLLNLKGLQFGSPILIRIFKQTDELELWLQAKTGDFELYKTFIICHHSGGLGPKQKEGDRQSPEGFYHIGKSQMNPLSKYHLSFNLGYPNKYDQAHERTGGALMVHGRCSSVGCFAMTDYYMDEIYTLAEAALENGQDEFQVHIFPFRFTQGNLEVYSSSEWFPFWLNLKEGFDLFEMHRIPPAIGVDSRRYMFSPPVKNGLAKLGSE